MTRQMNEGVPEARQYNQLIKNAWTNYQHIGEIAEKELRSDIVDSWDMSRNLGVDPLQNSIKKVLPEAELMDHIKSNKQYLSYARKQIQGISELSDESKTVISIVERNGIILESIGEVAMLQQAEVSNIYAGGMWNEQSAGTNAIGIALRTRRPAQVLFSEHFCKSAHDWYCVSFPILAPFTKEILGIINIASKANHVNHHTIGHVIAEAHNVARSVEHYYYEQALQQQLFANKVLEITDEIILSVDLRKNIVSKNNTATNYPFLTNHSTTQFPQLDALIEDVFQSRAEKTNEVITEQDHMFSVSVYPVFFQQQMYGAVVYMKVDKQLQPKANKTNQLSSDKGETTRYTFADIIGTSPRFSYVKKQAQKAAKIPLTLMLLGETGTGKEMFAQAIHHASNRRNNPFIAINSAAMPESLLESELFGYDAGTFTGSNKNGKKGKFEAAHQGTIFIDEIGDMPLQTQAHLLRVLEERSVMRLGSNKQIPIDVRVIAATNKNLGDEMKKGNFREDLYYRLHVIKIEIPPLRDRKDDIPLLADSFMNQLGHLFGK